MNREMRREVVESLAVRLSIMPNVPGGQAAFNVIRRMIEDTTRDYTVQQDGSVIKQPIPYPCGRV